MEVWLAHFSSRPACSGYALILNCVACLKRVEDLVQLTHEHLNQLFFRSVP